MSDLLKPEETGLTLRLRELTPARVGLRRAGRALATAEVLAFQMDHAEARDAVLVALDVEAVVAGLHGLGMRTVALRSQAANRATYLRRPDLGRRLEPASAEKLAHEDVDLAIVVADGLSARAIATNAIPFLTHLIPNLREAGITIGRVAVVTEGRVAVGDEIGERMGAALSLVLIGERPGLSAADSMGAYLTWHPKPSRTDAERNCVSNIRPGGLDPTAAAATVLSLLLEARSRKLTGVALKQDG